MAAHKVIQLYVAPLDADRSAEEQGLISGSACAFKQLPAEAVWKLVVGAA